MYFVVKINVKRIIFHVINVIIITSSKCAMKSANHCYILSWGNVIRLAVKDEYNI